MPVYPDTLVPCPAEPLPELLSWINHADSLTNKLKNKTGNANIYVLNQGLIKTNWWEKFTLGITDAEVYRREILMSSNQNQCWYARTMIPKQSFAENRVLFDRLQHEPITNLIFKNKSIQRQSFYSYALTPQCIEYYWVAPYLPDEADILWARLAEYTVDGHYSFYLIEVFLPGLMRTLS
jgi:chorismate lyase